MARRGENIHKRKDGRWEGRYIKGRSETGKAIWGYVYAYSYVDAKSALIRKKVKAADYTVPLGAQELTISVLSELWLSTLNDLEDSSIAHYRYSIEHYILPVIGNLRISQLSRAKLELCVLQIISPVGGEHKPFGTSLSRECISLVRRLCKYAYTLHLMPMIELSIKPVKETSEFSEALSLEEQAAVSRFVFKNPTPRKAGILFMLQLGLRMRWASATMAALMFFQCTAPVAFAADDAILAESSIAVSSADSESVPADSDAGYIPEQSPENTSVDSSSMNEASSEPLTGDSSASSDLPEDASSNSSVESQPESDTDQISTSDETIDSELAESSSENTDESAKSLYQDGKILIYTYNQLAEIGSGQTLTDASGLAVTDENGAEITYALDAQYAIAEDIELTGDMLQWQLPEGFTGSITPLTENSDDLTLYDAQSDTIYLYNPYQLSVLQAEDPAKEPVLDGDAHADSFGMGQLIYPKGEDAPYLTYSLTHHYVISTQFSSEITDAPISVLDDSPAGSTDGRDFAGQVVKTIGDKTYILIGNEQQLRKIGSGDTVYGAVYQAIHHNAKWTIDHDSSGNLIMLYGGDADLTKEQNGTDNYTLGKDGIHAADKNLSDKASNILYVYTVGRCGVNQTTGKIDPNLDIDKAANQTYASNANYIIFRDIDLSSANWTPLTFQGTMIGAKSANGEKIWNDDSSAINTSTKPTISNVSVMQTGKLNVGKQMGVGFFSTISSEVSENDIGLSKGLVQVSNLKFQNISVQTTTSETYYPETLVSELTSTLGKLLGGVLSGLTFILTFGQVKIDLGKTLGDVLDARKKDPTALATGAIAGRVEGQVLFSGIEVVNADVKNVNNNTGGFVGYTVGVTEYDGLSNALGGLVKLLSNILNVIPGLGLGDLITILLGNAIPLDKLIPTGYINAKFVDCSIDGLNISTSNEKDYAGGFVGQQSGSIIETCTVKNSNLSLQGKNFVGGFVGLARDSIIKGTLSGALDIETKLPKMNTESLLLGCSLSDTSVTVNSVNYAGGFAGGLANTAAVNCSATGSFAVSATESNAGGFAGIATLGWAANLGKEDTKKDLLGGVVDLVVKLLSSNPGAASSLLSLAGVNPSYILGCTVDAPLTVNGTDYVGGVTGRGDGVYIAPSSADYLSKVSYWRNSNQLYGIRCQASQCAAQCRWLCRSDEDRRRSRTRHSQHCITRNCL